jgi:predicted nucleotidyltransferase
MDFHELHLTENQRATLNRFTAACQADDHILAAFVGGSYARGDTDQYSDLDLFFITTDEAYDKFLTEREDFVHKMGEPIFMEDWGVTHGYCLMLSNQVEVEFWFGRASAYQHLYSGPYAVLVDKRHILVGDAFPALIADPTDQLDVLRRQMYGFWHDLSHFIKALGRKKLWFASGELEVLRRICVILARLNHNFTDAYLDENEPHFKIEASIPAEKLSALEATFCALEYDALLRAGRDICRFFLDIAPSLAEAHGLHYPIELEQMWMPKMQALVDAAKI